MHRGKLISTVDSNTAADQSSNAKSTWLAKLIVNILATASLSAAVISPQLMHQFKLLQNYIRSDTVQFRLSLGLALAALLPILMAIELGKKLIALTRSSKSDSASPRSSDPSSSLSRHFSIGTFLICAAIMPAILGDMIEPANFYDTDTGFALYEIVTLVLLLAIATSAAFVPAKLWIGRLATAFTICVGTCVLSAIGTVAFLQCIGAPNYGSLLRYISGICATSIGAVLIYTWFLSIRAAHPATETEPSSESIFPNGHIANVRGVRPSLRQLRHLAFAISCCICIYAFWWYAIHLWPTSDPHRSPAYLRSSPAFKQQLAKYYSPEIVATYSFSEENIDLFDFQDRLASHGDLVAAMPKWMNRALDTQLSLSARAKLIRQDNVLFQLAKISTLNFSSTATNELKMLGFSESEVAAIPSREIQPWIESILSEPSAIVTGNRLVSSRNEWFKSAKGNLVPWTTFDDYIGCMYETPWTPQELTAATEYCEAMQPVFQQIRDASKCSTLFAPMTHEPGSPWSSYFTFAEQMLTIDSNFQIGQGNLDRAIENLTAIVSLRRRDLPNRFHNPKTKVATRILLHRDCTAAQEDRVMEYIQPQSGLPNQADWAQALTLSQLERNYNLSLILQKRSPNNSSEPTPRLILNFSRAVDWQSYDAESLKILNEDIEVMSRFRQDPCDLSGLKQYIAKREQQVHWRVSAAAQALTILHTPASKGRFLARTNYKNGWLDGLMHVGIHERLSALSLQLELHNRDCGEYPITLSNLNTEIPEHLLVDPYSERQFKYVRKGRGFQLYSVGRNQIDEKGLNDDIVIDQLTKTVKDYVETRFLQIPLTPKW